jgi:hypothetical protein
MEIITNTSNLAIFLSFIINSNLLPTLVYDIFAYPFTTAVLLSLKLWRNTSKGSTLQLRGQ